MIIVVAAIITMIIILGLAAVGGSISERAGVVNLSIEGFMTIGAISYAIVAGGANFIDNRMSQWFLIPLAGVVAAVVAMIYSFIVVKLKANQTIAGMAFNTLALAISIFLIHSNMNPAGPRDNIEIQQSIWSLSETNDKIGWIFNIAVFMGAPLVALTVIFLNFTRQGKRIKSVGEQPHAAASLGIKVERTQIIAITISGFLAGIAGAMFAQFNGMYFSGSTQGIGFLAVALVVFGQWRPMFIIGGAILFGGAYGIVMQYVLIPGLNTLGHQEILQMIPFALSLVVLIFTSRRSKAPKALGIPYENAGR